LPIWMGQFEATALAMQLEGVQTPRPLTYAFALDLFQATGARLRAVRVNRLVEDVFYAQAIIDGPEGAPAQTIDARPSDALNLALVAGAPIQVDESVLHAIIDGEHLAALTQEDFEGTAAIIAELTKKWSASR